MGWKFVFKGFLGGCLLFLCGCIPLVFIGAGAVTGYLVTKDSVSGNIESSFDNLWQTALSVLSSQAEIMDKDKQRGVIQARAGRNSITVKITELTENSYNLKVSSRKSLAIANFSLAQKIFTKIIRNLNRE